MAPLNVFISSVSTEFGSYRAAISHLLNRPNVSVKTQEDFIAGGGVTLELLDVYISHCDIVIHLIGDRTGSTINAGSLAWLQTTYGDLSTLYPALAPALAGTVLTSYTQWEAYLALIHKKVLLIACPNPDVERDNTTYTTAEPSAAKQRQQQNEHLQCLYALDSRHPEITFANVDNLVAQVAVSTLLDLLRQATARQPPQNLPYPTLGPLFKGREVFLRTLREQLLPTVGSARKALYGLGGIGKTRLAIEYAWQYQAEYTALLFVRADKATSLENNLAALCGLLVPTSASPDPLKSEDQLRITLNWLSQNSGWLLIIDNVDTPEAVATAKEWLPRLTSGHILLTTRVSEWGKHADSLMVDVLHPDDAKSFLLARTPHRQTTPTDEDEALALAQDLGQLALALEHAGAYIDVLHITFSAYRMRLAANAATLLEWLDMGLTNDYECTIAATWLTTFQQLLPDAKTLLNRLAWLARAPVPRALLDVPVPNSTALDFALAERDLVRYSFLTHGANYTAFSVHRLVQLVTRTQLREDKQAAFQEALGWIDTAFDGNPQDVRTWPMLLPLQAHALELTTEYAPTFANPEPTGQLLNKVSLLLSAKAEFGRAEPLMRQALILVEASFGLNHPTVAACLNNLASLLQATNRMAEAEPLYRRALAITEDSLGPDHPEVALKLNNLAGLLQATNRLAEAEPLYRRGLALTEDSFGLDHPSVATQLSNLASLLHETNRLIEAEQLYRRALAIDEDSFGPDHPFVASCLSRLASLLQDTNRMAEAEPLYRRALAITEDSLGPDHPTVSVKLNNLASLLRATNRQADAEPLYRRALIIDEASFGPDHPEVALKLNNLATLLRATNRLAEAEPLYRRALAIDEESLGLDHPAVAVKLNNLAGLLETTNRLAEAEPLYRRALAITEDSLGSDHPTVATRLSNLAGLLQATNRLAEAESLYQQAVGILVSFHRRMNHIHPNFQACIINYIRLLRRLNYSEATIQAKLLELSIPTTASMPMDLV
jgi:tetratricopeptide (TPR) repeat protein